MNIYIKVLRLFLGLVLILLLASLSWDHSLAQCGIPELPILVAPPNGSATNINTPLFDWDAAIGATEYELQVDNNNDFLSTAIDLAQASTSFTPGSPLAEDTYYWRVRGHNTSSGCNEYGAYTPAWTVVIDTTPPAVPILSAPASGSLSGNPTPTFSWIASSGATLYWLQVDNNANFSSPEINQTTASTSYTPTTPLAVRTYNWRVQAQDAAGNWSSYSAAWQITIIVCNTPGAPVLVSPGDGSTTNDTTPFFDWNAAIDATEYQLQVDDISNFSTPALDVTVSATDYTPASALLNTTYYWRVRGRNTTSGCGAYGAYSSTWSFTTPPAMFNKQSPSNGAKGLPLNPTLSWQTSSGATTYKYCIDTVNDNVCSSWTDVVNTSVQLSNLSYATTYYWHVAACNLACTYSNADTWWSFTTNDAYEPDDTSGSAKTITSGVTQLHSITPASDADWMKFTLTTESGVVLQTNGTGAWDTQIGLYNSTLTLIENDDNSGPGSYSFIDRACMLDSLPKGTYFVRVAGGGTSEIPIYTLSFSAHSCHIYLPVIYQNYIPYFEGAFEQEPNNTSAQANGLLHSGKAYQGYPNDNNDYFSFRTSKTGLITLNVNGHTAQGVQVLLYYQAATIENRIIIDNEPPYQIDIPNASPGIYYLQIYAVSGFNNSTPYTLTATFP